MNDAADIPQRIAVIGGGISGLAAAHRLVELDDSLDVILLEAGGRLGGVLHSLQRNGFMIERGADSFVTDLPAATKLCDRVGLGGQLVATNSQYRGAYVVRNGRLIKIPAGFQLMAPHRLWSMLTSGVLGLGGKLRLACEPWVSVRRDESDESIASFATRRMGHQVFERLVEPLYGGIYTADAEKLSAAATAAKFVQMERSCGSLVRGWKRQAPKRSEQESSGARYSLFVTPRDGMTTLVQAIAGQLPKGSIRVNRPVRRLSRTSALRREGAAGGNRWQIDLGERAPSEIVDGVIIAVPAPSAAEIVDNFDLDLSALLREIPYASSAVVCLGYPRDRVGHLLDAFGFVVPARENRQILACSFSNVKFPGRAPTGQVLLRAFVGGALQADLVEMGDLDLRRLVEQELQELIGVRGDSDLCEISRWQTAMPQYHVGHLDRVQRIEDLAAHQPGLELAGNAYRGVGIPQCISSGERAAERLLAGLGLRA